MKNYVKLSLLALLLAPINIAWGIETEHQATEHPIQHSFFDNETNRKEFAQRLTNQEHSNWIRKEEESTKEKVHAPGSDIKWKETGLFTADGRSKLSDKITGIGKRISDWFIDLSNGNRRSKVEDHFSKYSKSAVPGKVLFPEDSEAQKAFVALRPDIQLEQINNFAKTEQNKFNKKAKSLKNSINIFNQKQLDEQIEMLKQHKDSSKNNADTAGLLDANKHNNLLRMTIDENKTKKYQELHTDYINRLNNFRKEIDSVLQNNGQNVHLKFNIKTNEFEYHTGPSADSSQSYSLFGPSSEHEQNIYALHQQHGVTQDEKTAGIRQTPYDISEQSSGTIATEETEKRTSELQREFEEKAAQENRSAKSTILNFSDTKNSDENTPSMFSSNNDTTATDDLFNDFMNKQNSTASSNISSTQNSNHEDTFAKYTNMKTENNQHIPLNNPETNKDQNQITASNQVENSSFTNNQKEPEFKEQAATNAHEETTYDSSNYNPFGSSSSSPDEEATYGSSNYNHYSNLNNNLFGSPNSSSNHNPYEEPTSYNSNDPYKTSSSASSNVDDLLRQFTTE